MTPEEVLRPGWVQVVGDRILRVGYGAPPSAPDVEDLDASLVPGFVDTHAHGGGGTSFDTEDRAAAIAAVQSHRAHGTTSMISSLVTAPLEVLMRQVATLRELVHEGDLAGIHLEGPWLNPARRGAHDASALVDPDPEALERLLGSAGDAIRMVTLAPELPHGLDVVRRIVGHGAVAAIGHTDATYETARAAIEAGVTVATHLFNAMPGMHHREPGPVLALLEDPRVSVELIADGVHVHPHLLAHVARTAAGGFHLVSDAMAAATAGDGTFRVGSQAVDVRSGVARVIGTHTLAGSTLTVADAVRQAVAAGIPFHKAITAATEAPARQLGIHDVGVLRAGKRADFVLLDADLRPVRIMRLGRWI